MVTLPLAGNDCQLHLKKVRWVLQDPVEGQAKCVNQSGFTIEVMEKSLSQ